MATKLSAIAITHISLVKAGANGKSIIYKSSDIEPSFTKTIEIKKSDIEEGVVYGIVYSPDDIDTDNEYASADEIKKAAYLFMKNKNTANVDKNHTFDIEKAFVAQSWILKKNDAIFPDEAEGSWAVAIQLEDEALIKSVKSGEIAGISMAGVAVRAEDDIEKADEKSFSLNELLGVFTKLFSSTSVDIRGHVYNDKINKKENDLKKEELEKAVGLAVEPLMKKINDLEDEVKALQKSNDKTQEILKQSKQDNTPPSSVVKAQSEGIL